MGRRELIFALVGAVLVAIYVWLGAQLISAVGPVTASPTPRPTAPAVQVGAPRLPGAIAFALRGDIYVLRDGRYAALTSEGRNSQPALTADGTAVWYVRQEQIDGTRISDGQLVNARLAYSSILRKPSGGGLEETVLNGLRQRRANGMHLVSWYLGPAVAPDGRRFAVVEDDGDGAADLVVWSFGNAVPSASPRATVPVRPTAPAIRSEGAELADPAWSPRGESIAVTGYGGDQAELFIYPADRGAPIAVAGLPDGDAYRPSYSPDGSWIVYTLRRDGKNDVHAFNLSSKRDVALTGDGRSWNAVFSPDGTWIAFLRERSGTIDLYAMELGDALRGGAPKEPLKLTRGEGLDGASRPSWAR
ncbi:MAG: PD40 domain-containing protein [Chloroflexi bacterium]|nr:PD40 domain-containing protein [Chloroflexota bacterium]